MAKTAFLPRTFLLGSALGVLGAFGLVAGPAVLSGCKSVELSGSADTTATTVTGTATLRVSNKITKNPDSLTFFLFPSSAVDFASTSKATKLGGARVNGTVALTVPAGTFKLAFEDGTGGFVPMRDLQSAGQEWLKAIFVKDGDYSLIISSDGNGDPSWDPTFKTDPAIR